jgi:hypothetical protein
VEKAERLPPEKLPSTLDVGWLVYDIPLISTSTYMKWLQNQVFVPFSFFGHCSFLFILVVFKSNKDKEI